jgi:hypothetical protein
LLAFSDPGSTPGASTKFLYSSPSVRYPVNCGNERDSRDDQVRKPAVVRHKQIGSRGCRARQLNGIGRFDPIATANVAISFRGFLAEGNDVDRSP